MNIRLEITKFDDDVSSLAIATENSGFNSTPELLEKCKELHTRFQAIFKQVITHPEASLREQEMSRCLDIRLRLVHIDVALMPNEANNNDTTNDAKEGSKDVEITLNTNEANNNDLKRKTDDEEVPGFEKKTRELDTTKASQQHRFNDQLLTAVEVYRRFGEEFSKKAFQQEQVERDAREAIGLEIARRERELQEKNLQVQRDARFAEELLKKDGERFDGEVTALYDRAQNMQRSNITEGLQLSGQIVELIQRTPSELREVLHGIAKDVIRSVLTALDKSIEEARVQIQRNGVQNASRTIQQFFTKYLELMSDRVKAYINDRTGGDNALYHFYELAHNITANVNTSLNNNIALTDDDWRRFCSLHEHLKTVLSLYFS